MLLLVYFIFLTIINSHSVEPINYDTSKETGHQNRDIIDRQSDSPSPEWLFARSPAKSSRQPSAHESLLDVKLQEILGRIGPDMKPASGFRDYDDISVELAVRAWRLMHDQVRDVSEERISAMWPSIEKTLIESKVSRKCIAAAQNVAIGAKTLKIWANQLLNSWGTFPPSGLFEGSLGDIGSYHSCVNIDENELFRHAHYCTIAFKPVVSYRRDYGLLLDQEPNELLEAFNKSDSFHLLASKAQYYHYVYLKLGTCFPIDCTPNDVQKFAHQLASRWYFMSGPVKCHSKISEDYKESDPGTGKALELSSRDLNQGVYIWKPHLTTTQLVSLVTLGSLLALIIFFTCLDIILNRIPEYKRVSRVASGDGRAVSCSNGRQSEDGQLSNAPINGNLDALRSDLNNNSNNGRNINKPTDIQLDCVSSKKGIANHSFTSRFNQQKQGNSPKHSKNGWMQFVSDCSIITNTKEFLVISRQQLDNDILCMNGLRCLTMSWIIIAHTIQYNDWSAFARIYEVETHLKSLVTQPLFNASYLVDTFFLISGLLTSYTVFRKKVNQADADHQLSKANFLEILERFSYRSYLIGRYLRLTPQILLVSMLFILLPLLSPTGGPHWYTMTGEYSENCANNWWINMLHIQAFYKSEEMCNFVCWWISVDMFYHLIALAVLLIILKLGPKIVLKLCLALAFVNAIIQAGRHYQMSLPPNLLSTIPQTGAMWSDMTLKFFWTPFAHSFPFLFGFFVGYRLVDMKARQSKHKDWFTFRRVLIGWSLSISSFLLILYGTYFWITGVAGYTRSSSTCFYLFTQFIWSLSLTWIIIACEFGFGSFIARLLTCKLFLVLGKASYLVYLSHFLILFTFFGSQNLLLEPTQLMISYIVIGNICLSMLFGSILCVLFEMPWLKIQRRIVRKIK